MKKKIKLMGLLMCFVATSMMVSCNKDEVNSTNIVGTWGCVHSRLITSRGINTSFEDNARGDIVRFNEDGTYTSNIPYPPFYSNSDETWMIDGNTLILNGDGCEINIQELNNTTLKIKYDNHYFDLDRSYLYEFKKQ